MLLNLYLKLLSKKITTKHQKKYKSFVNALNTLQDVEKKNTEDTTIETLTQEIEQLKKQIITQFNDLQRENIDDENLQANKEILDTLNKNATTVFCPNNNKSSSIKINNDPTFQYYGMENVSYDVLSKSSSPIIQSAIKVATATGPLVLSIVNPISLSWLYKKYPLIDKILYFHLNKAFANLIIKNINISSQEEITQFNTIIKQPLHYLFKINKDILQTILLSEKYGGACLVLTNNNKTYTYNRFDIQKITDKEVIFVDGNHFARKNCFICSSSYQAETVQLRHLLKGWGYSWLDKYYEFFNPIMRCLASINEFISKMQMIALYSNNFSNQNFSGKGYNAKTILQKISDTSNNSVISLHKDNDKLEYLTSNINLAPLTDFLTTQLSVGLSVPRSYFDDGVLHSGLISNIGDNISTQSVVDEVNRLNTHYQSFLSQILEFIYNKYIDIFTTNNISLDILMIQNNIDQQYLTKDKEIEFKLKQAELEEKLANIQEIKSRFDFKVDNE